ncbi:hypothetical protein BDR22DRAFT_874289 [Usnea florida]
MLRPVTLFALATSLEAILIVDKGDVFLESESGAHMKSETTVWNLKRAPSRWRSVISKLQG